MPTVLVADDNSNIQRMVGLALKDEGVTVVTVGNGEAALRRMEEVKPDLILADIFMPVRNGYEVCEAVKHDARWAHIPVVLLVGAFDPLDEEEVKRCGADGVLKKPFVPVEPLVTAVKSLLERSMRAAENGQRVAALAVAESNAAATQAAVEEKTRDAEEFTMAPAPDYSLLEQPEAFGSLLEAQVAPTELTAELGTGPAAEEIVAAEQGETKVFQGANLGGFDLLESATGNGMQAAPEMQAGEWDGAPLAEPSGSFLPELPQMPASFERDILMTEETQEITPIGAAPAPELITTADEWLASGAQSESLDAPGVEAPKAVSWGEQPLEGLVAELRSQEEIVEERRTELPQPLTRVEEGTWGAGESLQVERIERVGESAVEEIRASAEWSSPVVSESEQAQAVEEADAEAYIPQASWPTNAKPVLGTDESLRTAAAVFMEDSEPDTGNAGVAAAGSVEATPEMTAEMVDTVVARVLERLTPQVMEQITREVLRPLAEELVKREGGKKKS